MESKTALKPALAFSVFLYLNVFLNHMIVYKNLNCISQRNLYISSLFTEMEEWGGDLRVDIKHPHPQFQ